MKNKTLFLIILGIVVILALAVFICLDYFSSYPKTCTKEAKVCPDGTNVGRNFSNNCEFNECPELEYYIACGCGCCSMENPRIECLYKSQGDSIQKIIDQDKNASKNPSCAVMGCAFPTKYVYCPDTK
jgi:hypothetical protein